MLVVVRGTCECGSCVGFSALGFAECDAALARLAKDAPDFPNLAEAELWRGRALAALNKARAAGQAFGRVLSLDAQTGAGVLSARARLGLGKLSHSDQRFEEALSDFLKVAVLYSDDEAVAEALYLAGVCLEALGDPANALLRYQEVVAEPTVDMSRLQEVLIVLSPIRGGKAKATKKK